MPRVVVPRWIKQHQIVITIYRDNLKRLAQLKNVQSNLWICVGVTIVNIFYRVGMCYCSMKTQTCDEDVAEVLAYDLYRREDCTLTGRRSAEIPITTGSNVFEIKNHNRQKSYTVTVTKLSENVEPVDPFKPETSIAPSTAIPTLLPTKAPSSTLPSAVPSKSPSTSIPTSDPITAIPTFDPTTSIPSFDPTTLMPTIDPTTTFPTIQPSLIHR
eukprot:UN23935